MNTLDVFIIYNLFSLDHLGHKSIQTLVVFININYINILLLGTGVFIIDNIHSFIITFL